MWKPFGSVQPKKHGSLSLMRFAYVLMLCLCFLAAAGTASAATPRIVGGQAALAADWGFVAALETSYGSQFCGGSLVAPQWVLTAGHCRIYSPGAVRVVTGATDLTVSNGQVLMVDRQLRHPLYRQPVQGAPRDDLMLVHLTTPSAATVIPIATGVKPPAAGTLLRVAGWGATSYTSGNDSYGPGTSVLQQTPVRVSPAATCTDAYGTDAFETADMVCAALPGKDACAGDSGGPLVSGKGASGLLVGVVSWGTGCGLKAYPGVYSLTVHNRCWIESTIGLPTTPSPVATAESDGALTIDWQWTKPCAGAPDPTGFRVRVLETGQTVELGGSARRLHLTGLANGVPLTVSVAATNLNGESTPISASATPGPNLVTAQEAIWSAYHQVTSTFVLAPHATDIQWRVETGTRLRFSPKPWQLAPASATPSTITVITDGLAVDHDLDVRIATATGDVITATERIQLAKPSAPKAISAPKLTGAPGVGQTLHCDLGRWSGTRPFVVTRQWLRDGRKLAGATDPTLLVQRADAGSALTCRVSVSGPGGRVQQTTAKVVVGS